MFNAEYRHVIDPKLSSVIRYRKFRHCLEWYSYLTRQSFQATYLRIGKEFGFDEFQKPDEMQLLQAAQLLNQERINFLQKLEIFTERRRANKLHGRRQPSKSELEMLYYPDWIKK